MCQLKIGFTAALLVAALCLPAASQNAKDSAKETKTAPKTNPDSVESRYFATLGDIMGDLPVEAFIKETRQGGKVSSALIDVCYSVTASSERKDRFIVELKPEGDRLVGSGQTLESKTPVTVNLLRKLANKTVAFEGKIVIGGNASLISSPDNSDISEKEFLQTQTIDDDLVESPKDFTQESPHAIGVRVKRESLIDLVQNLKNENVQIALDSIATDCSALRTGHQVLRLTVDPARVAALTAKLKTAPGVVATGWTTGNYDIERAVRFAASDWSSGGKLDKDKLAAALSSAASKAFSAKQVSSIWNATTGEITFAVKRPSQLAPALNLVETLEIKALIGPESPTSHDRMVVWLGIPSSKTTDESAGAHLQFSENSSGDEESAFNDDDGLIKATTLELKGQRWDADKASWK